MFKFIFFPKIKSALEEMLGVRCSPVFTAGSKYQENYEDRPSKYNNAETAEVHAYCGRSSCKNCKTLYKATSTGATKFSSLFDSKWVSI